ncbi:MAG: YihY/virulence factor BrkB family protein [Acidimicrobiales bacterium]
MTAAVVAETAPPANPSLVEMGKHLLVRIKAHNVVIMCAGIAFYGVLAMVPTLIALVTIYGLVTDPDQIADQIKSLSERMDPDTAELIGSQLEGIVDSAKGGGGIFALVSGIVLALWAASGAVQKLMLSISMAYATIERRKGWKVRGIAYLFTLGGIVGVALLVFLLGALPAVMSEIGLSGPTKLLLNILRFPLLAALFAGALTFLYRYSPDRDHKTPWWNPGAIAGTIAFMLFAGLFSFYVSSAGGMPPSYGVLGSIAALIIFFQLCAIAVIIGAEVNATYEGEDLDPSSRGSSLLSQKTEALKQVEPVKLGTAIAGLAAIMFLGKGD